MARIASIDSETVLQQETMLDKSYLEPKDIGKTLIEDRKTKPARITPQNKPAKPRGRPAGVKNKTPKPNVAAPTGAARGRKQKAAAAGDLSDMEGEPSSEPNTSPQMRVRSQGIDLGSEDTGGSEVEDGYVDSDLEDFVVGDDQPLTQVDSSLPSPSALMKKTQPRMTQLSQLSPIESSQDLPELGTLIGTAVAAKKQTMKVPAAIIEESSSAEKENRPRVTVNKRRRVVSDDDDDD
jgi:ATP-dependent DNA helicase MPH1